MKPWLASFMVALGACDSAPTDGVDRLPRASCAIVVVASDYRSSSTVSLLAADGRPCATDVVHSGSRPPGLLTALSGDVVVPTTAPAPDGLHDVVLIDRYPNGIVTRLDPAQHDVPVRAQYALAPGFPGNPQDILFVDAHTALVSRLEHDPSTNADAATGSAPIDFIDGSDLLVIDWDDGSRLARIDLDAAAEVGFDPMPTRLARTGDLVWVGLAHLSPRFDGAGPGRVAVVDVTTRTLIAPVALAGWSNCAHVSAAPDGSGVWAVCSGQFARAGTPQLAKSGLAWIDATTRAVTWSRDAVDLVGAPLGFSLAALDGPRVLAVAVGDTDSARPDRLLLVDRSTGTTTLLEAGPFELGALLPSVDAGVVLVAVGDPIAPRIERLRLSDFGREAPITTYTTTGLPPRSLTFFR